MATRFNSDFSSLTCLCGCGANTRAGSLFLPGHDAKLKSKIRRATWGAYLDDIPDYILIFAVLWVTSRGFALDEETRGRVLRHLNVKGWNPNRAAYYEAKAMWERQQESNKQDDKRWNEWQREQNEWREEQARKEREEQARKEQEQRKQREEQARKAQAPSNERFVITGRLDPWQTARILGVTTTDLFNDIKAVKKQYRALVLEHHPDRGGDTKVMQAINLAWQYAESMTR